MKSKYKKVELATIEEFDIFIKKHKKIKYLDVILGDLSGIIRGKRIPISDADKIFKSGEIVDEKVWRLPLGEEYDNVLYGGSGVDLKWPKKRMFVSKKDKKLQTLNDFCKTSAGL